MVMDFHMVIPILHGIWVDMVIPIMDMVMDMVMDTDMDTMDIIIHIGVMIIMDIIREVITVIIINHYTTVPAVQLPTIELPQQTLLTGEELPVHVLQPAQQLLAL